MAPPPFGIRLLCGRRQRSVKRWKAVIFLFTLIIYTIFHASRKPMSVVKSVLHPNCSEIAGKENKSLVPENATFCMWKPFDGDNYNAIFGYLDLAYLLSYAGGMFVSGHIAERMNLRVFLTWGCILSGITTAAFGLGYFLRIHSLAFYFIIQTAGGLVQSTGWPAVLTCMGNWFGKKRRGFILGVWNSHASLGNIVGGLLAGIFVDVAWGWSFVVPGLLVIVMGVVVSLFLVPYPEDLGFSAASATVKTDERGCEEATEASPDRPPESADVNEDTEPLLGSEGGQVSREDVRAISFCGALAVPGVVEYSSCIFFIKFAVFIFLFWLPRYIREANGFEATLSADVSTVFDVGGIVGGVVAGLVMDRMACSATVCVVMLLLGMPSLYVYYLVGASSVPVCMSLLLLLGFLIVGPFALISTTVSADLGSQWSLRGNAKALATIVAIMDGTASFGAALGPCIVGLLVDYGWLYTFLMLIASLGIAVMCLLRRAFKELRACNRSSTHSVPPP